MARRYEDKTIPARTKRIVTERTCDLCSAKAAAISGPCADWSKENFDFDVAETEVRYKSGESYPEGGSGTEVVVDICPQCFNDKLMPWLREQGVTVEETEWDW